MESAGRLGGLMPDEQTVGRPQTPLPGGGDLGQLPTILTPDPVAPDATSATPPKSASPTVGSEYMAVFVGETHAYVTQYIQAADQKAIFMFSAAAALLAFLYQDGAPAHWIKPLSEWGLISVLTFVGSTALAAAAALSVAVVVPRLPGDGQDLVSFNGIARHLSKDAYAAAVLGATPDGLLAAKSQHSYTLARVCRDKYYVLRAAVLLQVVGVAATLLYFVFSATTRVKL